MNTYIDEENNEYLLFENGEQITEHINLIEKKLLKAEKTRNVFVILTIVLATVLGFLIYSNFDYIAFKTMFTKTYIYQSSLQELVDWELDEENADIGKYFDDAVISVFIDKLYEISCNLNDVLKGKTRDDITDEVIRNVLTAIRDHQEILKPMLKGIKKTISSAPCSLYITAYSTGSPTSLMPTKLTPLTTLPSRTSKQGIIRLANILSLLSAPSGWPGPSPASLYTVICRRWRHTARPGVRPRCPQDPEYRRWR